MRASSTQVLLHLKPGILPRGAHASVGRLAILRAFRRYAGPAKGS